MFPFSPTAATGVFLSLSLVGGSWTAESVALQSTSTCVTGREGALPGVSMGVWMCLSQSPAATSCVSRAWGVGGCASNRSKWNQAVAFGDLTDSHREGLNTARALHTLPLCSSRTACSCFDKRFLNIFFFFSWYMFRYLPFSWQRNLEKISLFFFFNKQSYISKWKSISSKKVEIFFLWKCYNRVFDSKNVFFVKTKLPLEMLFYWIDMFWPKKNNIGRGVEKSVTCCSLFAPQWLRLGSKILCFN